MNADDITNSGAFGLSGLLLAHNHRSDAFSSWFDIRTYAWNYRNEMTGFSEKNSSGTVIASGTYTYDSLDRRIGVNETSGGTTTQTWIVYNGNSNTPYAEFNGSGTLLERYLAGPSYVPGVTGMVARTSASGVTDWYLTGKLGSIRDIVNTSGTVIDHISYGAFGSIRAETNPSSGSQFKFDGMQYDTITGLYNDWHREYSSSTGRFITIDPTGFLSNSLNLYIFGDNTPSYFTDSNGFWVNPPISTKSNIAEGVNGGSTPMPGSFANGGANNNVNNTAIGANNPPNQGNGQGAGGIGGGGAGAAGAGSAGGSNSSGTGQGTGGGGPDLANPIIAQIAQQGQLMAAQDQAGILQDAKTDARIVIDYGKSVASSAQSMIVHMIKSLIRKYRLYIHGGSRFGDPNLTVNIVIHFPGMNGGRSPEYGPITQGSEWGQGWVGAPSTPTSVQPPQPVSDIGILTGSLGG